MMLGREGGRTERERARERARARAIVNVGDRLDVTQLRRVSECTFVMYELRALVEFVLRVLFCEPDD